MSWRSHTLACALVATVMAADGASAAKVAVLTPRVEAGGAFPTEARARAVGDALGDAIAAAASRGGDDVVTEQQIQALVGLESARQLAGCDGGSCSADLGAALGVDVILTARVTRVGAGALLVLKRIDMHGEGGRVVDRRLPVAALAPMLDALPALVGEVMSAAPTPSTPPRAPPTASATQPTSTTSPAPATPAPPSTATATTTTSMTTTTPPTRAAPAARVDATHPDAATLARRLTVAVDETSRRMIAFLADDPLHGALFSGAVGGPLYEARLIGGSQGDGGFDLVFWDPRFRDGWQRSVARAGGAGGAGGADVVTLQCGDVATTFKILPDARSRQALAKVALRQPAWRRALLAAGRDDDLTWYLVDGARDAPADAPDLALYVGRKGHISVVDAEGARVGEDLVFVGDGVKLRLPPMGAGDDGRPRAGTFTLGGASRAVTPVDIFAVAAEVYGVVRPWGDLPLGTPCDRAPVDAAAPRAAR